MQVSAWDTAFVRARRRDVHPMLADIGRYGDWWPGVRSSGDRDSFRLVLTPPTAAARLTGRTQALVGRVRKVRRDLGVDLDYRGTFTGRAEWYYLDERAGTTVHYLVRAEVADRGWRQVLGEHRASVRTALAALKDRLEGGRPAGAEPEPALLRDQEQAMAAFAAGVAAWERRQRGEEDG
jgi:hypothetical protein